MDDALIFIMEHKDTLNKMDMGLFMSIICVMMEEWCANNGADIIEMSKEIASVVEQVNHNFGRYAGDPQKPSDAR